MSDTNDKTPGYKALWAIIQNENFPTRDDLQQVVEDIGGHDDRISSVHLLASVLQAFASIVAEDCAQMSYDQGKEADRYGDNPACKDHYMSQVWYAYDAKRMETYADMVVDAHQTDDDLMQARDALQEEKGGEMTQEEAEEALENL